MRLCLLLALLFNLGLPADVAAGSLNDSLLPIQQNYWLKLLHYYKGKSRIDGEKFFLSKEGKTNPQSELEATIEQFKNPNAVAGWFNYHPQCVFRERYEFLKKAKLLEGVVEKPCTEFFEWKKGLNAESATLVFSSSYPNNPSSLFGHTLIRLNQKNKVDKTSADLLDYSISFSAMPEKEDLGVVFAFKGFTGGYKGLIEITKYYTKVAEYNDGESRDLIEYDLVMSEEELDRLINHVWEIYQTTYFDYFFVDENCSSVLVDILAVAFMFDEINSHSRWYYLPSEMVKSIKNIPGRVKSEHFRPSLKKQLEYRLVRLSSEQLSSLKNIIKMGELPQDYGDTEVVDALIGHLDFNRYRTKNQLSEKEKILLRKSLLRRSNLPMANVEKNKVFNQRNRPDRGHEPQKFSFFSRVDDGDSVVGVEFKHGYHDLMSNDLGFDPFSEFDFFTGSAIYNLKHNRLLYDKLTLVNLTSFHTYTFYDPQFSWSAGIFADRLYDLDCQFCHKLNARAYLGPTFKPNSDTAFSLLMGIFGEVGDALRKGHRVGLGAEISLYHQWGEFNKIALVEEIRADATYQIKKDFYHKSMLRFSYFPEINSEWRVESSMTSHFKSFSSKLWVNQLSYGFYF